MINKNIIKEYFERKKTMNNETYNKVLNNPILRNQVAKPEQIKLMVEDLIDVFEKELTEEFELSTKNEPEVKE